MNEMNSVIRLLVTSHKELQKFTTEVCFIKGVGACMPAGVVDSLVHVFLPSRVPSGGCKREVTG